MTDRPERVDPVSLLESMAPLPGWDERTDTSTDQPAAAMLERVMSGKVVPFRSRRRRLRLVTGIVVGVALGGTAAVAALWERSPEQASTLSCWSDSGPDPEARVGLPWDGVDDPIETCTPEWNGGDLGEEGPPNTLNVCVTDRGLAAVIPGDDATCDVLGFAPYVPLDPGEQTGNAGDDPIGLRTADKLINQRYNQVTCVGAEQVQVGAMEILEELGFVGWETSIGGTKTAVEQCATVSLKHSEKLAIIVFLERAG